MVLVSMLVVAIAVIICYMLKVAHEHNVLTHLVEVKGATDKLKLVFISDVHNRVISSKQRHLLENADAVIIGGDFCDNRTSEQTVIKNLQLLQSFGPLYFVWGNNDREFGEQRLRELFQRFQVTVVENDAVLLPNRANHTWVAAIDDTSTRNYSFTQALEKCDNDDITICVSHNPQVFHLARQQKKLSLLLGGHLHGGQIRLGKYGLHPHGSFSIRHGVATLISNGYGTTLMPLRLGAKPQLHVVQLNVVANSKSK